MNSNKKIRIHSQKKVPICLATENQSILAVYL